MVLFTLPPSRYHASSHVPATIYLFKVNNRNTTKRCEMCSKLTIETLENVTGDFLLTLNIFHTFFYCCL